MSPLCIKGDNNKIARLRQPKIKTVTINWLEEDNIILLDISDTENINYDLIAIISDKSSSDDDDIFTPSTTNQTLVLKSWKMIF